MASIKKILLTGALLGIVYTNSVGARETVNYEKNCITQSVDSSSITKSVRYYVVNYDENGIQSANQKGSILDTENDEVKTSELESCIPMANKYNIGDVLFDFDQFYLKDSQKPKIRTTYREEIVGKAVKRVVVDGYADSVGTPIYNMKLSIQRANRVAGYLESLGVDKHLIMTRGFGESKNIAEDNERERAEDRKVIISIISK